MPAIGNAAGAFDGATADDAEFQKQVETVTKETEKKVDVTLSSINRALAEWKNAKTKLPAVAKKVEKLKKWQQALGEWQQIAKKAKPRDTQTNILLLRSIQEVYAALGANA